MMRFYPVECANCGHKFEAAASVAMMLGFNHGHARCSRCSEFLHLRIIPDADGDEMDSMLWSDYLALEQAG